jgi:transposase
MAYSLDLRTRIVDAVDGGVGTISEITTLFGVHEPFIYKLLRQKRERGAIAPLPTGDGAQAKRKSASRSTKGVTSRPSAH